MADASVTDFGGVIALMARSGVECNLWMKRAAGRPKDHDMLAGLEALLEERSGRRDP